MRKWLLAVLALTATFALIVVCRAFFGLGFWTTILVTQIPTFFIIGPAMDAFGLPSWVPVYRAMRSARIIEGDRNEQ